MLIDTSFDFRTDAAGKDPDVYSPTLRRYHKLLWSKALPGGAPFGLNDNVPGVYLHHRSELGEFFLSSDSVIPTFTGWGAMRRITALFSEEENEVFNTIGGMIFPANQVDRKQTINGAHGFNRKMTPTGSTDASPSSSSRRETVGSTDTLLHCSDVASAGEVPQPLEAAPQRSGAPMTAPAAACLPAVAIPLAGSSSRRFGSRQFAMLMRPLNSPQPLSANQLPDSIWGKSGPPTFALPWLAKVPAIARSATAGRMLAEGELRLAGHAER